MSNQALTFFSLLIMFCIAALLAVQFLPTFGTFETQTYLQHNSVRGIEVIHGEKPWTLNLEQQNAFVSAVNHGANIDSSHIEKDPSLFPYTSVAVQQFDKPDIIFTPVNFQGENIIFEVPEIVKKGYLIEGSNGELNKILSKSFDQ